MVPVPLLQAVMVPMIMAGIISVIGRKVGKYSGYILGGALIYTTLILVQVAFQVSRTQTPIYEEYAWAPLYGLKFGFLADNLSIPIAIVMNIVCAALAVFSVKYADHRVEVIYGGKNSKTFNTIYHTIFPLFATGLLGTAFTTDLILLYVFQDLLIIPMYFLMAYFGYIDRKRIAALCFLWMISGTILYLIGALLVYAQIGSFAIANLHLLINTPRVTLIFMFLLLSQLVKMGTFGFHVWIPRVHGEHPTSIAGTLAALVGITAYIVTRLLIEQLFPIFQSFSIILMIYAIGTMVYGAFLTYNQDDVKRLYACSTVSQTAYSLLGLASCTPLGIVGGLFYFLSHSLGKCILFSVAAILVYQTGVRNMREMGGLAYRMPATASLCIAGSMILSALPPLSGFQAEWIMFAGIFIQGTYGGWVKLAVALGGILATILTVGYTFWPVKRIFFGPIDKKYHNIKEAPATLVGPTIGLGVVAFILGIFPNIIMDFLASYAENLFLMWP